MTLSEKELAKIADRYNEIRGIVDLLEKEKAELRDRVLTLGKGEFWAGAWKIAIADREKRSLDTKMAEAKLGAALDPFWKKTTATYLDIKNVGKTAGSLL